MQARILREILGIWRELFGVSSCTAWDILPPPPVTVAAGEEEEYSPLVSNWMRLRFIVGDKVVYLTKDIVTKLERRRGSRGAYGTVLCVIVVSAKECQLL